MSKRSEIKIALEKVLREGKGHGAVVRDSRRRPILIPDILVDVDKIARSGRSFLDMGRRIRVQPADAKGQEEAWVVPTELIAISRDDPGAAAGLSLPFGTLVQDRGLWLKYAPGFRELGVNDRGDILVGRSHPGAAAGAGAAEADGAAAGPVRNAINTTVIGRTKRVVARMDAAEHAKDRAEAEAWLKILAGVEGGKTLKAEFKSAGIDCVHHTNDPYLHRTARLSFYDVRDSEMLRIESLIKLRFRKARRDVPRISVYALTGVPKDPAAFAAFFRKAKAAKKDPAKTGIPAKPADSRFYDAAAKSIAPGAYFFLPPLGKLPAELTVITINTDAHGDTKARGVLSPLMGIMSLIDLLSARTSVAVLSKGGHALNIMGGTGAGKSTMALFWADRNEKYKRLELRRRYEMDLRRTPDAGRLGEAGIQKELDRVMERVGIVCQEDWVEILKEGAGHWVFWPAERCMYARTAGFPGLSYVLSENDPQLENVAADFGGSGDVAGLGRVDHECATERLFYDPEWGHLQYDKSPRKIAANILLERSAEPGPIVRRLTAREAVDWLIAGRTPEGGFEPLQNPYPDFCGLLIQAGLVGDKLVEAYAAAQRGDFTLMGAGDPKLGERIHERFDLQVKLWLDNCREVPTFILNGAGGVEMTQDVAWLLAEHPDLFGGWKQVAVEEFQKYMSERYGVAYGPRGEWMHIPPSARR